MRRSAALLCLLLCALAPAQRAWADGDPASDVLLSQDVFFPYAPNTTSKPVERALADTVKRAREKGFPVKIALIASARDLGSVAQLYTEPQKYADLLTQELSLNVVHGSKIQAPRVLTIAPNGIGGNNLGDNAGDALADVIPEEGADGLARTAALAVGKLSAADGKPISMPPLPAAAATSGGGGGGIPAWVTFGLPALLLVGAIVGTNVVLGRREDAEDPAPEPSV